MARTAWPTVLSGDSWSASQHNTYGRDNDLAYWVYTAAGDLAYATSSSTLARLALVTGGLLYGGASAPAWLAKPGTADTYLLKNTSAGTPSWLLGSNLAGLIHAVNSVEYDAADQSISGTAWTDVTNATVNITTTVTCTIYMFASGTIATNAAGNRGKVRANINGTAQSSGYVHTSNVYYVPFGFLHYRTGVASGTITCKLQGAGNAAGNSAIFNSGKIVVIAVPE